MPMAVSPLLPGPKPSTARPPETSASVAMPIAWTAGWREYGSAVSGPTRSRSVAMATGHSSP